MKDSPPDKVAVSRLRWVHSSTTSSPRPDFRLRPAFASVWLRVYRCPLMVESRTEAAMATCSSLAART